MAPVLANWAGPVSVAVYASDADAASLLPDWRALGLVDRQEVHLHVVYAVAVRERGCMIFSPFIRRRK